MSDPRSRPSTAPVVFAGGGTGGHIFPNLAIWERLRQLQPQAQAVFHVSNRPGDAATMQALGLKYESSSITPLPPVSRPWRWPGFVGLWRRCVAQAHERLARDQVETVVATGGFVSGPVMVAAAKLGLRCVLVNLDAVPGKANRRLRRRATKLFSAHACEGWDDAEVIGLPLRAASIGPDDQGRARECLGLGPDRETLLITGATHGAQSIIEMMLALIARPEFCAVLRDWQVFHQCGGYDVDVLSAAYAAAGIDAKVVDRTDQIGCAWRAASLAISRAGAGSVAEAVANATPTVFLPNPYHADGHQRANARALEVAKAAMIIADHVDPATNVERHQALFTRLIEHASERDAMAQSLRAVQPEDGANRVARWIVGV